MSGSATRLERAARARRLMAHAIDSALLAGFARLGVERRLAQAARPRGLDQDGSDAGGWSDAVSSPQAQQLLAGAVGAASERLGSPGQRIVGLRTVNSETGRPVALRARLLLVALDLAARELTSGLLRRTVAEIESARRELKRDVDEAVAEHGDDPQERRRAICATFERWRAERGPGSGEDIAPLLAAGAVVGLLTRRLHRALAPTVVVVRRPAREMVGEERDS